ncbi:HNH endonuclease signature motif containing protein [Methylomonas montana]|uniref:HNH endonuclease signature motif containing protein n=1 Tax=Methylomonas montana TaxID=3058963 RepID=UPI00265997D8|nr:HNH endonuclease signature motif containing protein [Methylomonas montana]WKJ88791.1 HNH endonuclease signature motif containing protein [Methylomonas montana]
MKNHHRYTPEQIDWLRKNRKLWLISETVDKFNAEFKTSLSKSAINGACKRLKIYTGRTGLFTKSGTSWNAGLKIGSKGKSTSTQFKKGGTPHNALPVGAERIKADGYLWQKIAEPDQWRQKHRILWEERNGPIPDDMRLVFKDGDLANFAEDNFELVSNAELLRLCKNQYRAQPTELKPVVMTLSKLQVRIFDKCRSVQEVG